VHVLLETKDGVMHRVAVGDHMGQRDGKIIEITPSKIVLIEIPPDAFVGPFLPTRVLRLN